MSEASFSVVVVGAGPSGLAVAAALGRLSVPCVILERSDGIADLWRRRTYDRLNLHLPKHFCQLPHLPFPSHFPTYPSKGQFLDYLHSYADRFALRPLFGCAVVDARFDLATDLWRVTAVRRNLSDQCTCVQAASPPRSISSSQSSENSPSESSSSHASSEYSPARPRAEEEVVEFVTPWLVVATGENAEPVVPELKGAELFKGSALHSSEYKSGTAYEGKKILVIGCGNSGMEICVDLCEHGAAPVLSVRSEVHVLPREMLGASTFCVAMRLLKWLPTRLVDRVLLIAAKMIVGDTAKYGLKRPKMGPLELKETTGKTPVLDAGALSLIKQRRIKVVPEVKSLTRDGAKFVDGQEMPFDSVVFATGYKSNVPLWLKGTDGFSEEGKPKTPFPNGCSGENGVYFVGFRGKGLLGASADAVKASLHISQAYHYYRNHSGRQGSLQSKTSSSATATATATTF